MATKFNTQHILVIDLEASCWRGSPPSGQFNEIIEIGVCKVDYKTKEIIEKESIIVKNKKSEISYFCTELTTLTQEYIDEHGIDFSEACDILKNKYKSKNVLWFSWGQYDKNQFKRNCELYNIENPFNNDFHYNIKRLFTIRHGLKNELGVSNGLEHLGMTFEGTPHRGDDDSMNISKLFSNVFGKKIDVKNIDIPNVCFSLTDKKDKREDKFIKQRLERGFDDSETWSLDCTIAKFIFPRLKVFKEVATGFPSCFEKKEEWDSILESMIVAFELMSDKVSHTNEEHIKINNGMDLFREHFYKLWW